MMSAFITDEQLLILLVKEIQNVAGFHPGPVQPTRADRVSLLPNKRQANRESCLESTKGKDLPAFQRIFP